MEVQSEIYDETDFNSVSIASGNVISKFRFNFPVNREDLIQQLELDEDSDVLVPRRKNRMH